MKLNKINQWILCFVLIACFSDKAISQNYSAGVNVDSPNPNAVLHLVSPNGNQGLIIPSVSTSQRTGTNGMSANLTNDDNGLLVYDSDLGQFFYWLNAQWIGLIIQNQSLNLDGSQLSISGDAGIIDLTQAETDPVWNSDKTILSSTGTVNNAANLIDWSQLKNVPAGFADGEDNGGLADLSGLTSDDLTEGATNLYYTDARVATTLGTTSVTALSNVTNAGSGQIITAAERALISSAIQTESDPDWNADKTTLASVGTINDAANLIDWSQLKNVPTDFSDGVDDGGGITDLTSFTSDDLTEGTANLYITSAERATIASTITAESDPDWNADKTTLASAGTINDAANLIDWSQLKNVPADFSDGVDDGGGITDLTSFTSDDLTEGTTNLYITSAERATIASAITAESDPDWNADKTTLASAGTINDAANLIDWSQLKNVPTDFSDGVDDGGGVTDLTSFTSDDLTEGTTNLYINSAERATIASAITAESDPDWNADKTTLASAGTINDATNLIDWSQLKNVPTDFSDGVDDGGGVTDLTSFTSDDLTEGTTNLYDQNVTIADAGSGNITVGGTYPNFTLDATNASELPAQGSIDIGKFLQADGLGGVSYQDEIDPTVPANLKDGVDWSELSGIPTDFSDGIDDVGVADLVSFDTDDLTEGTTNLYYTDARTDARVATAIGTTSVTALSDVTNAGSGAIITAAERALIGTTDLSGEDTDDLAEGATNLYYTDVRVATYIGTTNIDTDNTDDITTANLGTGIGQVLSFATANTLPALNGSALTNLPTTAVNVDATMVGDGLVGTELGVNVGTGAGQILAFTTANTLPVLNGSALTNLPTTAVNVDATMVGDGLTGTELGVNVGTGAGQILAFTTANTLPVLNGSALTNLPTTAVNVDATMVGDGLAGTELGVNVGTGAGQILAFTTANTLPALNGSALTNLPTTAVNVDATMVGDGLVGTELGVNVGTGAGQILAFTTANTLPVLNGSALTNLPTTAVNVDATMVGDGLVGTELGVNVGTGAGQILAFTTANTLPVLNGSALTNLPTTAVNVDATMVGDGLAGTELGVNVGTGAGQILAFTTANTLPALDGSALTNIAASASLGSDFSLDDGTGNLATFDLSSLSAAQSFTFPDASGTLALEGAPPSFNMGFAQSANTVAFGSNTLIPAPVGKILQVIDDNSGNGGGVLAAATFNSTDLTNDRSSFTLIGSRGTQAIPAAVGEFDILGTLGFNGYDDTNFTGGAEIYAFASENWSNGSTGTDLIFASTENGSSGVQDRFAILSTGDVVLMGDDPSGVTHSLIFEDENGDEILGFKAPDNITTSNSVIWTLPDGDGALGEVLTTDGVGNLGWSSPGGFTLPYTDSDNSTFSSFDIYNSGGGSAATFGASGAAAIEVDGDIAFFEGVNRKIGIYDNGSADGSNMNLEAGSTTDNASNGGNLNLSAGAGGGTSGAGGNVNITAGDGASNGMIHAHGIVRFGQSDAGLPGAIEFEDNTGTNLVEIRANGSTASYTLTLPTASVAGTLTNPGNGELFWDASAFAYQVDANDNHIAGGSSGASLSTGTNNIFAGENIGNSIDAGAFNIMMGTVIAPSATTASDNILIGNGVTIGVSGDDFYNNVIIGNQTAGTLESGGDLNVIIGHQAGGNIDNGTNNVTIGALANAASGVSGAVAIGSEAEATGVNSVALGNQTLADGANSVVIGHGTETTADYAVVIGDGTVNSTFNVGIGTPTPATRLDVDGDATLRRNLISTPLTFTDQIAGNVMPAPTSRIIRISESADNSFNSIDTGIDGQEVIFVNIGSNVDVNSGGNINLNQDMPLAMTPGSSLHLVYIEALNEWIEISRSE